MNDRPVSSRFEFWPPLFFYLPVGLYYGWLSLRFGSATLPTASNPSIYAGGLIGESKTQILELIPRHQRPWVASWVSLEAAGRAPPREVLQHASRLLNQAGLSLPVVAKPDRGQRGDGVQLVRCPEELLEYLTRFPAGQRVLLQEWVDLPGEAGILYYRRPGRRRGRIFSITLKLLPRVRGDGRHTLRELILRDPRAHRIAAIYLRRHRSRLEEVLEAGTEFRLVFAGNHCQGAVFKNGIEHATPQLTRRIEEIASSLPDFHFGRFDVKYRTLEELREGQGFRIVEVNGAGAEATHIWDAEARLRDAYRTLFQQFRILFEIGAENRRRGVKPLGLGQLLKTAWQYRRMSADYPETH